jgi:surface antigen
MKKWVAITVSSICAVSLLSGCTPGNNTTGSTVAGGVAGGLLGAVLFHGSGAWIGVAAGALIGSLVGNKIGQYMDQQDKLNMQHAIETVPVGQEATWTNSKDVTYTVKPIKQYQAKNHYCREYQTSIKIDGQWKRAYGKACRKPDGSWQVVN